MLSYGSAAQRSNIKDYVRIEITPDHDDWTYRTNEQASFTIRVIRGNVALKNIPLTYEIGPEKMPPVQTGKSRMEKGFLTVKAGTMKTPGFTTCLCRTEVDGIVYSNYVNIGFSPDKLEPTTTLPKDFTNFGNVPKQKRPYTDSTSYHSPTGTMYSGNQCIPCAPATLQKRNLPLRILCIPKKSGKYPAVLRVPGAGVKKQPAEMAWRKKE